jgi:hypothetical protein
MVFSPLLRERVGREESRQPDFHLAWLQVGFSRDLETLGNTSLGDFSLGFENCNLLPLYRLIQGAFRFEATLASFLPIHDALHLLAIIRTVALFFISTVLESTLLYYVYSAEETD